LEVAIRDIYDYPTIVGLAARLKWKEPEPAPRDPPNPNPNPPRPATSHESVPTSSPATRIACALSQALALYLVYAVTAVPYFGTLFPIMAWRAGSLSLLGCVGVWLLVWGGTWPTLLALSVAAKWILIGRYRPGRYPLWGWYYFRWWLVRRFQMITGSAFLTGTPLMPLYLRAMGARVGRRCTIDTPNFAIFDLLTIGDDTSIGSETQLLGDRVEDSCLLVGSIDIGSRCFVGMHSALGLDVRMGDDARLDDQSLLADATSIAPRESKRGSPARPAAVSVPEPGVEHVERQARPMLFGFLHVAVLYGLGFLMIPTAIPAWTLLHLVQRAQSSLWLMASIPVIGTVTLVALCLWIALLNQLILPRVRPGVYPVESGFYLRKWAVDTLMQLSRTLARPLYTTIYLPSWLRLLGAKIGRRAEISTVSQISPKLTHIGDQSFFADGAMIGGRRVHRGLVQLAESRIGRRSFVGNGAILPVGTSLGDNSLLGVLSAPPARYQRTPDGSEWLGSPSFALPHRRKLEGFAQTVTHEPTRKLIAQRLLIDGLRIVIPSTLVTGALVGLTELVEYGYDALPFFAWVLALPLAAMVFAAAALVCVVAIKKVLIGTFVPTVKPLWSMFVWLNEALNGAYETVGAPILALLLGTPYCAPWLRLLGCKIGHNVFLETTLFSEFDLVHIGDNVALNAGAVIQNHLFEDRIMKVSVVTVGDFCSVGNMAVVLYDTEMQAGSSIGPLSLLMKGETLPPQTKWAGIPTAQAARWGEQTSRFEPLLPVVSGASPLERSL
jgi:non-ribosomal peptide synthetase-like protein